MAKHRLERLPTVDDVAAVTDFAVFVCAFCAQPAADDPRYIHLTLDSQYTGERQALGAHAACLRRAVHDSIPLVDG